MAEQQLDSGNISFQTEGRLLQELGERLVASPQVALVELIKNSYDADATECRVSLAGNEASLLIKDDGTGMTFQQFSSRWMRIATSHKLLERVSVKHKRHLTGQKGIGRFAVRFLGNGLHLDSVAWDENRKCLTRLLADFDWQKLDKNENLSDAEIPYQLLRVDKSEPTGTTLTVHSLRVDATFAKSSDFRTAVLKIVSPLSGLDGGRFRKQSDPKGRDPGFRAILPDDTGSHEKEFDLARQVLEHAWGRLSIDLSGRSLTYTVSFDDSAKPSHLNAQLDSRIRNGVVADIRFFPRRAGVFSAVEVKGRDAWTWVRNNCGVAVIDHGFRIPPYGLKDDDWLMLDADGAHNERNWRSTISRRRFPIPEEARLRGENPMLNLPSNFQLVGAVFVESAATGARTDRDLVTSMDREGFLSNDAFKQLGDVIRGGIEFLALQDRIRKQREAEERAKEAARQTRADLRAAVTYIENSPTLTKPDKARLVEEYSGLARKLTEVEEYDREARRKLETMSALGVVAGFMTHEASKILASLDEALTELRKIAVKHPSLTPKVTEIEHSYRALEAHLDYTKTFIDATQKGQVTSFKVAPQVKRIIEKFGEFARTRGISVDCDIDNSLEAPRMPVTVYSGILLNLYTNALKAIVAAPSSEKSSKILFRAENEERWHILEVLDTGIGIPPNLRDRVWDPLFTTTSRLNNPLGSGMGLGLSLVRQLVEQTGGHVRLVDAPKEYSTCFQVQFPRT